MDSFRDLHERSRRVFANLIGDWAVQHVYSVGDVNVPRPNSNATIMTVPGAGAVPILHVYHEASSMSGDRQGVIYLALLNSGSWVVVNCYLLAPQEVSELVQWVEIINEARETGQEQLAAALQQPPPTLQILGCWHLGLQHAKYLNDDHGEVSMLPTSPPGFGQFGISRIVRRDLNAMIQRYRSEDGEISFKRTFFLQNSRVDP